MAGVSSSKHAASVLLGFQKQVSLFLGILQLPQPQYKEVQPT